MKKYLCLIFLIALFLVSCGGGNSGVSSTTPPPGSGIDTNIPPTVSLLTPVNGASNITLNPTIQIQFSESVENVNSTTIQLHTGSESGPVVAIGQIILGSNNTYTFSPQSALQPTTTYYLTLSNGITNLSGIPLIPTVFSFITDGIATPESYAPTVAMINPTNGESNVSTSTNIQLKFSESVENVNSTTVSVHTGSESGPVVAIGQIIASNDNTYYTFYPESSLQITTSYYVTLSGGITNLSGVALVPTIFNFTTKSAAIPPASPTVVMLSPLNAATNVSLNPNIQLQFNTAVKNVNIANVTLHENSVNGHIVAIDNIIAGNNNTYTFSPIYSLNQSAKYYVVLNDKITNEAGVALAPTNYYFTTGNFTVPIATMVAPSNNATKVSTYPNIQIKFSTPVINVNTTNVTIHQGTANGPKVKISSITQDADNLYTLSGITLNEYTKYYVELSSGITSPSGAVLTPTTFNFITGANITLTGPGGTQYVANKEQMLFTNNSGAYVTISSITSNAAVAVLIYSEGDSCTNRTVQNHSSCSFTVNISQYYTDPTLVNMAVNYSNGMSSTFPIYISYYAVK